MTFSSGTGGAPSVVPRDELTLAALRSGSGVRQPWSLPAGEYDCLLLTDPGMGSGMQAGAAGIAGDAFRSHHHEVPARTVEFLGAAAAQARPVLVYGAPARLAAFLDDLDDLDGPGVGSAPGSCVVTGGGWKGSGGGEVRDLLDRAAAALGVDRTKCLDTYSWSELNTFLLSCPHDRYHVPPVVEAMVVDDLLRPVEGDADGRLAVLDPMAASYPGMIATSDFVRLRHDACPCGRAGQTLLPGDPADAGCPAPRVWRVHWIARHERDRASRQPRRGGGGSTPLAGSAPRLPGGPALADRRRALARPGRARRGALDRRPAPRSSPPAERRAAVQVDVHPALPAHDLVEPDPAAVVAELMALPIGDRARAGRRVRARARRLARTSSLRRWPAARGRAGPSEPRRGGAGGRTVRRRRRR